MQNEVDGQNRYWCSRPQSATPYEVGLWQEKITWNVISGSIEDHLGSGRADFTTSANVKQTVSWGSSAYKLTLTWYKPNTHPITIGSTSKPEFNLSINGTPISNFESKNWRVDYKPLSYFQVDKQIISRFRYVKAPRNILIISELRLEEAVSENILNLLGEWNVKLVLTQTNY